MDFIKKWCLVLAMAWAATGVAYAQSGMSDTQIMEYIVQQNAKGTSRDKIVKQLIERGVTIEQIRKAKEKYEKQQKGTVPGARNISGAEADNFTRLRKNNGDKRRNEQTTGRRPQRSDRENPDDPTLSERDRTRLQQARTDAYNEELDAFLPDSMGYYTNDYEQFVEDEEEGKIKVFGRNIFNNKRLTFEPNMNIATPDDYRLGPGDEVYIDVWGASQQRFECTVSPEGVINIENFGPVQVSGLTVAQTNARLRSTLGARYAGSDVRLTVGQTRTITVDVMGEVKTPGTYTLSAFSTVFHALYMAGGTNDIGTLRNIKVFRNGRQITTCDIYDYILNGNMKGNVRLQPGDVVVVGSYECLVQVTGKVKRPMYYEMKSTESVGTLLRYAGGFTGDAYDQLVRLIRKSGGQLSVFSLDEFERGNFQLADGDSVAVDSTLQRYRNMVEVKGAVFRTGKYQMDGSITTVRQLIEAAGGLCEDAMKTRAVLHRLTDERRLQVVQVDLQGILAHTAPDIALRNEDVLFIPSRSYLIGEQKLSIHGEVVYPGEYDFAENTTLEDFILQAGGLTDAASLVKVDVSRRIRNQLATESSDKIAESYTFKLKDGFVVDGTPGFVLQPYDEVYVRRSPGYVEQQNVEVKGEVAFEGRYALVTKGMRLSDLVKQCGGLTPQSYAPGAHLERKLSPEEQLKQQSMIKLATLGDTTDVRRLELSDVRVVAINLEKAIANPGSNQWDLVLQEGDVLVVPQYSNTVTINGEVLYPNTVGYDKNMKLRDYINSAGGFTQKARTGKVFAVGMNGSVTKVRSKKDITPGCNIVVPAKMRRRGVSLAEMMSVFTMLATLGTVVATLVK
ncbi:MAG: SLBB domain-containing protein [Bacteroidales bacterium]|nr:SLBB domain-containing protein [Bacteroidales bacterium]